jgi:hypothetical protein
VNLAGTVTDDGLPITPGVVTSVWSEVSGLVPVSFGNPVVVATTATFAQPGVYTLRLTASDGDFVRSSDVIVTVTSAIAVWKAQYFTAAELADPAISGDLADPDADGHNNLQEFIAGTNPHDAQNVLRLEVIDVTGVPRLRFRAEAGKSYSLFYRDSFARGSWLKLTDVASSPSAQTIEIPDALPASVRYYQVATPQQP